MRAEDVGFGLEYKLRVEFGPGRVARLGELASAATRAGGPRLIVSDRGLAASGLVDDVAARLRAGGHGVVVSSELEGEPEASDVDRLAALIRTEGPGVIIALGGGSALDLAKLAACVAAGKSGALAYALVAQPLPVGVPVVAVPTTAGTGAEVTATAVFSDRGRKLWAWGTPLRPVVALLDPELMVGLPRALTIACALDALVHGLEAATNRRRNPFSEAYGLRAVDLVAERLPDVVLRPDDTEARGDLLLAACLAGLAIDIAGTGIAHALGHALGSVRHVAHGPAVALGLGAALAWNVEGAPGRHQALARTLGIRPDLAPPELARAFDVWWCRFQDRLGRPLGALARQLDPERDRGPLLEALAAPENRPMVQANARHVSEPDHELLIERLFALNSTPHDR